MSDFKPLSIGRRTALLGLGGAAVAACTRSGEAEAPGEREIVVTSGSEITGIDPARTGFLFSRLEVVETLMGADDQGNPIPALANRWEISADKLTWRFTLRPTAKFHDGSAVTSEAVAKVLNRARAQQGVFDYAPIEAIEAEPGVVVIRLKSPSNLLTSILAHYSGSIYGPASFDDKGLAVTVVGTGPYAMSDLSNQGFAFRLAPTWDGPKPQVTKGRFVSASRAETRGVMAESGQADLVFDLDPASLKRLRGRKSLTIISTMIPRTVQLNMNAGHPFLADVRARRALSLAIDRPGVAGGIMRDPTTQADQLFAPIMKGWRDPALAPLKTDPQEAKRLLAELGWKAGPDGVLVRDGKRFSLKLLTYTNRPELPPIAAAVQAQLKLVGIEIAITVDNQSAVPAAHRDKSMELALIARGYVNIADPAGTLALDYLNGGGDWGPLGWSDPRLDAALRGLSSGAEPERRAELRKTVADVLHAELPTIPVAWYYLHAAQGARVKGATLDLLERNYRVSQLSWT